MTQPPATPRVQRSERKRPEDTPSARPAQYGSASGAYTQPPYGAASDAYTYTSSGAASNAYTPPPYGAEREPTTRSEASGQRSNMSQPTASTMQGAQRGLPTDSGTAAAHSPTQPRTRVHRFSGQTLDASLGTAYESQPEQARTPASAHPQANPSNESLGVRARNANKRKQARNARGITYAAVGVLALLVMIFAGLYIGATANLTRITRERAEAQSAYETLVGRHTVKYRDLVQRYAEENNLQPAYVAAIILRESSYNPDAISSAGARGLMQLMPDTAEWVAEKLNVSNFTFDMMFDPETNIRFGTWYLGYLSGAGQFAGDPVLMACAYHAGQGNVRSWLGRYAGPDGVLSIDEIPMDDTRSYAQKVLSAYAIYTQHVYRP